MLTQVRLRQFCSRLEQDLVCNSTKALRSFSFQGCKPSKMYRHFYGCLNSLISAKGFSLIEYFRNIFLLHFQLKPPRMRNWGAVKSPSTIQHFQSARQRFYTYRSSSLLPFVEKQKKKEIPACINAGQYRGNRNRYAGHKRREQRNNKTASKVCLLARVVLRGERSPVFPLCDAHLPIREIVRVSSVRKTQMQK